MIRSLVLLMRKHNFLIFVPVLIGLFCWTLMTDAVEKEPSTLDYLELFAQCYELIQGRYLEDTDPWILAEGAVEGMLLQANPYSAIVPLSGSSNLIPPLGPLETGLVIGYHEPMIRVIDVLKGSPAEKQGIMPGDTLIRINDQVTPYLTIDRAERMLTGNEGDTITLLLQNHLTGELKELTLQLEPFEREESVMEFILQDSVRIIKIQGKATISTSEKLYSELKSSDKTLPTILDLRKFNRGDELLGVRIADLFIADNETVLHTCSKDNKILGNVITNDGHNLTGFPLAVILDGTSAGPAEACAAALHGAKRAIITGDTSFGKAVLRETHVLDSHYEISLVTGFFCNTEGDTLYLKGVKPDIPVILPVEEDVDPYLATAIRQVVDSTQPSE